MNDQHLLIQMEHRVRIFHEWPGPGAKNW